MKKRSNLLIGLLVLSMWSAMAGASGGFVEGWTAYRAGDYKAAYRIWLPLAKAGSDVAQNNLGMMYLNGRGVERNVDEAAHWFRTAVLAGNAQAQTSLGVMHIQGLGVGQDYAAAFELFYVAARSGYAPAQFNMGRMYAEGLGVSQNYEKALKWFQQAAGQGHQGARQSQEQLSRQGLGLPRSPYTKDSRWVKFG